MIPRDAFVTNHRFDEDGFCQDCGLEATMPYCSLTRSYETCPHCATLDDCEALIYPPVN